MPAATVGLQAEDPTIAELLKTARLRHGPVRQEPSGRSQRVSAHRARLRRVLRQPLPPQRRREPELPIYPPAADFPHFRERFAPRGVLHCWATDTDDPTEQPHWGRVGKQRIEDTGR